MKKYYLLIALTLSDLAHASENWESCESSFRAIHAATLEFIAKIDSATPENIHKTSPYMEIPKVSGCPSGYYFEDMPFELRTYITERLEDFEMSRTVVDGKRASEVLEIFKRTHKTATEAKVRSTFSAKLRAAKDEAQYRKRQSGKKPDSR